MKPKRLFLFPSLLYLLTIPHTVFTFASSFNSCANTIEEEECDIVLEHGLCLYNGDKLLFADAQPEGLIGHWTFDDYKGLDTSGNHNHANSLLKPGPGMGGIGYSVAVGGKDYVTIPNSASFDAKVFSVTFWVFLIKGQETAQETKFCPLLVKGSKNKEKSEQTPAILFDKKERTLKVAVTTTENDAETEGEFINSKAKLSYNRWTHIAVVRQERKLKLYVNGILDSVIQTIGWTITNTSPLYVGNAPFAEEECDIPAYIDEMRFYTRGLNEEEIEAEASPALGNINPNFVQLGCINCSIKQAAESCVEGYHLCSTIELHSGVYQVARTMGWTSWNSKIWSYSAIKQNIEGKDEVGLGICCID